MFHTFTFHEMLWPRFERFERFERPEIEQPAPRGGWRKLKPVTPEGKRHHPVAKTPRSRRPR